MDLRGLVAANGERWRTARFSQWALGLGRKVARRLTDPRAKAVYKDLEAATSVPWWAIAVIHEREAAQRWDRSIAQGDPWNKRSVHVPRGRGPFRSFRDCAIDALMSCPPHAGKWRDWSPGGALTILEMYNGLGYEQYHNMASPYIWSGTQHYQRGKYVADGRFDANAVDKQLGCAALIKAMAELDPEVAFAGDDAPLPQSRPDIGDDSSETFRADGERPIDIDYSQQEVQPPVYNRIPGASYAPVPVPDEPPKPMARSKIGWLSQVLTWLGIGGAGSVLDDGVWDGLTRMVDKPQFWIFLGVAAVGATIFFFRWRDYGRGQRL